MIDKTASVRSIVVGTDQECASGSHEIAAQFVGSISLVVARPNIGDGGYSGIRGRCHIFGMYHCEKSILKAENSEDPLTSRSHETDSWGGVMSTGITSSNIILINSAQKLRCIIIHSDDCDSMERSVNFPEIRSMKYM
jgi:hypothetical protein